MNDNLKSTVNLLSLLAMVVMIVLFCYSVQATREYTTALNENTATINSFMKFSENREADCK
jgi:ABC-type cobalt transport system substrate-binding protein